MYLLETYIPAYYLTLAENHHMCFLQVHLPVRLVLVHRLGLWDSDKGRSSAGSLEYRRCASAVGGSGVEGRWRWGWGRGSGRGSWGRRLCCVSLGFLKCLGAHTHVEGQWGFGSEEVEETHCIECLVDMCQELMLDFVRRGCWREFWRDRQGLGKDVVIDRLRS